MSVYARRPARSNGRVQPHRAENANDISDVKSVGSRSSNNDYDRMKISGSKPRNSSGSDCSMILLEHADDSSSVCSSDERVLEDALLPPFENSKIHEQYRLFRSSIFHLPSFLAIKLFELVYSIVLAGRVLNDSSSYSLPETVVSEILCSIKICFDLYLCYYRFRTINRVEHVDIERGDASHQTSKQKPLNEKLTLVEKFLTSLWLGFFLLTLKTEKLDMSRADFSYYTLVMIALSIGPISHQLFNNTASWRVLCLFWVTNTSLVVAEFFFGLFWSGRFSGTSLIWTLMIFFMGYIQYQQERASITMYRYTQIALRSMKKEQESKIQEEKLEALKRSIHATSHDLKTPLQAMSIALQTCKSDVAIIQRVASQLKKNKKRAVLAVESILETFGVVSATTTTMELTINRALDFYRLSSGLVLTPNVETFDLRDLTLSVMATVDATNNSRSIAVLLEPVPAEICSHVTTDKSWLAENMLTMLLNSVKYSRDGHSIMLSLSLLPTDEDYCRDDGYFLRVEVSDFGIGLPSEGGAAWFSAIRSSQSVVGGSGLGLYCLRQRCLALGGDCGANLRSDGLQGAIVWMSIPYLPDEAAGVRMKRMSAARGSSILQCSQSIDVALAQYNAVGSNIRKTFSADHMANLHQSGTTVLTRAEGSFERENRGHNSTSFTRRSLGRLSEDNNSSRYSERSMSFVEAVASANAVINSSFSNMLRNSSSVRSSLMQLQTNGPLSVLVVEDSAYIMSALSRALEINGYRPVRATTAIEAISLMKSTFYELVVLGECLSDDDGKSVLAELRDFESKGAPGRKSSSHYEAPDHRPSCVLRQLVVLVAFNNETECQLSENTADIAQNSFAGGGKEDEEVESFGNELFLGGRPISINAQEHSHRKYATECSASLVPGKTAFHGAYIGADFVVSRSQGVQEVASFILDVLSQTYSTVNHRRASQNHSERCSPGANDFGGSGQLCTSERNRDFAADNTTVESTEPCSQQSEDVNDCLSKGKSELHSEKGASVDTNEAIMVLAVDDSPPILRVICRSLENAGFKVVAAKDGAEGLEKMKENLFDVVLTDIQMPVMDGNEMVRKYRELERSGGLNITGHSSLVIIGMSASDASTTRSTALQAGMDEFMSKPCSIDSFIIHLSRLLEERWQGKYRLEVDPDGNTVRKVIY